MRVGCGGGIKMVTPSRFFTSAKPFPTEQRDNATERESLHIALAQEEGAEIGILSDGTCLETGKPTLTRDGLYSVNLTMIVGASQHRRTTVVKARDGETEDGVQQRVHAAFVRSVCEARSVVLMTDEGVSRRSRRVQVR